MTEFTQKEISLLLFVMQDYWSRNVDEVETRDNILEKLRREVKYD
jgi:hypothetical protein